LWVSSFIRVMVNLTTPEASEAS